MLDRKADDTVYHSLVAGSKATNVASYVLIGRLLTLLMLGISLILVTRLLGSTNYGLYTLAIAFAGIFGSIGYFGIGTALNKFISEYKQAKKKDEINAIISNAIFILLVAGAVFFSFCILFSGILSQYVFHTVALSYLIILVAPYIVFLILFGAFYDALVGLGNGKQIMIVSVTQAFFQAAVSIGLAYMLEHTAYVVIAPIIGLIVGSCAGFVAGYYLVFKRNGVTLVRPSLKVIKKLLSFSAPIGLSYIGSALTGNIALIFIGYFVVLPVIGSIGITARTSSLVSVIFDSVGFALLPAFSAALADKRLRKNIGTIYGYAIYLAIALVGPMLFYVATFSTPFSYLIFGSSYASAPLYISIMCIGLLLGVAGSYASGLLVSANHVGLVFKYNIIANILVLFFLYITAPVVGGISYVVLIFLVSPLLSGSFFIIKLRHFFKLNFRLKKISRLVIADVVVSALAFSISFFFSGYVLLILAALFFLIAYPLIVTVIGGMDRGDIETIKALSKSIPFVGGLLGMFMNYPAMVA